jgi:hypothetical protein
MKHPRPAYPRSRGSGTHWPAAAGRRAVTAGPAGGWPGRQGVEGVVALAAAAHDPGQAQELQVAAEGRQGHAEFLGQGGHRLVLPRGQAQQPPRLVGGQPEQSRGLVYGQAGVRIARHRSPPVDFGGRLEPPHPCIEPWGGDRPPLFQPEGYPLPSAPLRRVPPPPAHPPSARRWHLGPLLRTSPSAASASSLPAEGEETTAGPVVPALQGSGDGQPPGGGSAPRIEQRPRPSTRTRPGVFPCTPPTHLGLLLGDQ